MKKKIVITPIGPKLVKKKLFLFLKSKFEYKFIGGINNNQKKILKFLQNAHAAIIGSEKINNSTLIKLKSLKIIVRFGGGLPDVDKYLAKKMGIKLYQVKTTRVSNEVSLLILSNILSHIFNTNIHNDKLKKGKWERLPNYNVEKLTIGLIGAGKIAHSLAQKLKFLGFEIGYWSKSKKISIEKFGLKRCLRIEQLIKNYKIICLVIASNSETKNLINKNLLSKMNQTILINTSRGSIVNEKDIIVAIKKGNIKKYFTDVTATEPPSNESKKLIKTKNVFSTPHIGGYSELNLIETSNKALDLVHKNI